MKNKAILILAFALALSLMTVPSVVYAVAEVETVYLGGKPIGIGLAEDGVIVTGMVDVITDEGAICPARGSEISTNDVIIAVNDEPISGVSDFARKVHKAQNELTLTVKRGEREHYITLTPVTDSLTGLKMLGLIVKEGIFGVGTLTFVTESMKFGALGHGIEDADTGKIFTGDSGQIYSCQIKDFKPPEQGKPGALNGMILDRNDPIGRINRVNAFGVYGVAKPDLIVDAQKIEIASRREVKTGEATIFSTVSGDTPKAYKVEIIKASSQKRAQDKSMLIRVTDEALLKETGGILQGMSGSPIVQNGKLVGAVTHVLVNDSTLGYGLYLDWMLENVA